MRRPRSFAVVLVAVAALGCTELQGLVDQGAAEGRALFERFNAWVEEGDRPGPGQPGDAAGASPDGTNPDAVRVHDDRRTGDGPPRFGTSGAPAAPPAAPAAQKAGRERFAAAYAVLACSQAATANPVERERRRTELFRVLGYTNFSWLDDLERFGTADGDALKALCLP